MNTRTIHASSVEGFTSLMKRLNKKAMKLGISPIEWSVSAPREETMTIHPEGAPSMELAVDVVDIEWSRDRLESGWEFRGTIELLESGESTLHLSAGKLSDVPEEFSSLAANHCSHCGTARRRKETFLLKRGEEFVQIGRTCLRDFLGHSEKGLLFIDEVWRSLPSEFDAEDSGGAFARAFRDVIDVRETLEKGIVLIREFGWLSKSAAGFGETPTVSRFSIFSDPRERALAARLLDGISDADRQEALDIVRHFAAKNDRNEDYEFKLGQLCRCGAVEKRNLGILVSAIESYRAARARQEARKLAGNSEHVSTPGVRLRALKLFYVSTRTLPDYGYGESFVHTFRDESGNLFEWKTSTIDDDGFTKGELILLDGTVKEHREWNGIKSTSLTRCKLK